jgi:carboxymethylenebutenolidase
MRLAALLSIFLLISGISLHAQAAELSNITQGTFTYFSDGKKIQLEVIKPAGSGRHPAVLILYGARGLTLRGPAFQQYARSLAKHGYVAMLPHYFDRFGDETMNQATPGKFTAWIKTIRDAITFAQNQKLVRDASVGIVGFSLGAYLGIACSAADPRVKVLVEYYGALTKDLTGQLKNMPPILILHGQLDKTVPVDEAYRLQRQLLAEDIPVELHIYPNAGHGFDTRTNTQTPDGDDAWGRALVFVSRWLPAKSEH